MKQLAVLLLPLGWDACPSQGTQHEATRSITTPPGWDASPQLLQAFCYLSLTVCRYSFIHLGQERISMWSMFSVQENNTTAETRLAPPTFRSKVQHMLTIRSPRFFYLLPYSPVGWPVSSGHAFQTALQNR